LLQSFAASPPNAVYIHYTYPVFILFSPYTNILYCKMCMSCRRSGRWLSGCPDRRVPRASNPPSPPAPPARQVGEIAPRIQSNAHMYQVPLRSYPTSTSVSASVPSNRSVRSVPSVRTNSSVASRVSIDSTATVNSVHSLQSLANQISRDLYPQEALVRELNNWLLTIDPETYRRNQPWSPEVLAAYNEYKRRADVLASARRVWKRTMDETESNTTPEQHLDRARAAVAWGEAALRYEIWPAFQSDHSNTRGSFGRNP
jgi:hypothetical protein